MSIVEDGFGDSLVKLTCGVDSLLFRGFGLGFGLGFDLSLGFGFTATSLSQQLVSVERLLGNELGIGVGAFVMS